MRILILGAGAVGGYFGARLQEAGGDVTFLVRPARAERLARDGLRVSSPFGDFRVTPKLVTAADGHYDIVIMSCKAYDLDSAIAAVAPAVGPASLVLPLLNGLAHLEALDARFGRERVLGGVAQIVATLAPDGEVRQMSRIHRLSFGVRGGAVPPALAQLAALAAKAPIDSQLSERIEQDMWDKVVFLASLAAATCTLRANIGEIVAAGGEAYLLGLLDECQAVAAANGRGASPQWLEICRGRLTEAGSALAASMLRDLEGGGPTEGDHVIGDLIRRGQAKGLALPRLDLARLHLAAYDQRRRLRPAS